MKNILTVENLTLSYEGKNVLENINFSVENGDFLVIFGENGSGKSTLIKALLNLKAPSKGEITLCEGMRHCDIGYLPQTALLEQNFPASVWEVVLSGTLNKMGLKPFYTKKEKDIAKKNMELLSIYDLKRECFRNLSGGQKQRVLLARALCSAKSLLLLDEPVSGLDPAATADFYEVICKINDAGTAVIMVSHDVHSSLSVAKHVLHIGAKTTIFFGTPHKYEIEQMGGM